MAADSAVMVIDSSKGVEDQTKKLFQVCKLRGIPIFTFINKMDRMGRDPFDLLEDIENILDIKSCPMNWPIGSGKILKVSITVLKIRLNCSQMVTWSIHCKNG